MSEMSLLVLIEAGQVRSLAGPAFQVPLPDALIWGPEVLPRIELIAEETEVWPKDSQLVSAVVVDRDARRLVRAGASDTFDTPYQSMLFDRMLSAAWEYEVEHVALTRQAIASAARIDAPPVDPNMSRRTLAATMGEDEDWDDDGEDWDDDDDEFLGGEGDDFRQLTTQRVTSDPESMMRQYEDQDWFVSIRTATDEPFRHYHGDFVLHSFVEGGPDIIQRLSQLREIAVPKEARTKRGIVVDVGPRSLSLWAHPRGVTSWDELDDEWPDWTIDRWLTDGYRRQLELTGEADRTVVPSDLQVLSGFVPTLTEQIDLQEMIGQIKSGVRGIVRRGFGCLAIVLAIPAMVAWAATGSWQGPFAFAATLWVIAYIGYRIVANKMKRNFSSLADKREQAEAMLPKLGPADKAERVRTVNRVLQAAGFPDFEQVEACAERDDDDDDESIEPIVSV